MTPQEMLADWLARKEKDYPKGVEIYTLLEIDNAKAKYFNTPSPGRIHLSILIRELDNYARKKGIRQVIYQPKKTVVPVVYKNPIITVRKKTDEPVKERPRIDGNPYVRREDLPVNLQVLFDMNGKLNGEMKTYHAELKACGEGDETKERRAELAKLLVDNEADIRKNWDTIDNWWNSRKDKTPEELAAEQAIEKQKRINSNLNYVRRYHGSKKPSQITELEKRKKELDAWGVSYEKLIGKASVPEQSAN